jgi:hypothetical protein
MQMQGGLTIRESCASADVSRASYYRNWRQRKPKDEEVALRDAIQRLALKDRHNGYRRIGRLLKREGWVINHKRVLRLMRQDNLLSIRRRRFVVTTDSEHGWRVYPNLARRMVVHDVNQLWVADITYIGIRNAFAYLAAIAPIVCWHLEDWAGLGERRVRWPRDPVGHLTVRVDRRWPILVTAAGSDGRAGTAPGVP